MSDPFLPEPPGEDAETDRQRAAEIDGPDEPDLLGADASEQARAAADDVGAQQAHWHDAAFQTPQAHERLSAEELEKDLETE